MKHNFKRFLSVMLSVLLFMTMLPANVIAAESNESSPSTVPLSETPANTGTGTLEDYITSNGGIFALTLFDANGNTVNDGDTLTLDTDYRLVMSFTMPNGITPGSYTTQVNAAGFNFGATSGTYQIANSDTSLGTWSIDANGLITSVFNEKADNYTQGVVNAAFNIHTDANATELSLGSNIYVVYTAPVEEVDNFTGYKSMSFLDAEGHEVAANGTLATDTCTKIFNTVTIIVNNEATVAGKTLRDQTGDTLYFSDEDKATGVNLMITTSGAVQHTITLSADQLTWTDNSWSYTFPGTLDGIDLTQASEVTRVRAYYVCSIEEPSGKQSEIRHNNNAYLEENGEQFFTTGTNILQIHDVGTGENTINKTGSRSGDTVNWTMSGTIAGAIPGYDKYSSIHFTDTLCVVTGSGWGRYQYLRLRRPAVGRRSRDR